MSVKILNCITLMPVGSCLLLCMLAVYVYTVCCCVWVRNGDKYMCLTYYVPLVGIKEVIGSVVIDYPQLVFFP
jgi:hypothetical protein